MAKPEYDETNRGTLFRNYDKEKLAKERDTTKWANAQGKLDIYGFKFYISAWTHIIKSGDNKGDRMQQLSVKPVDEDKGEELAKLIENFLNGNVKPNQKLDSKKDLSDELDNMDDDLPF